MKANFIIRAALQSDAVELKNLFQNTVLAINRRDYSQAEVEDWASCGDDLSNIENMIKLTNYLERKIVKGNKYEKTSTSLYNWKYDLKWMWSKRRK